MPESQTTALIRNGKIEGYGVLRLSDKGHRIGPLFANSYEVAEEIFKSLVGSVEEGKRIRVDIPSLNEEAMRLAQSHKMTVFYELNRMYTK